MDPSFGAKELLNALGNTSIHYFEYNVRSRTIAVPQRTCERFKCRPVYENMPYSFAEEFVLEKDFPLFNKMYGDINSGAETASALFRSKSENNWCRVTLTAAERDENGDTLRAVGIIEDLSREKQNEIRYSKWIEALGETYRTRCYVDLTDRT